MSLVELRLTADVGDATKNIAGLRKEYGELVKGIQKPLKKIEALQQSAESAKEASAEFYAARRRVEELKRVMAQAGQPVKGLATELANAERQLVKATNEFDRQKNKVRAQRAELQAAGIDTRNLAKEQARLQAELGKAVGSQRLDADLQGAMRSLGVDQFRAARTAIADQQRQFELLRKSGKLSATEIAIAQQSLRQSIAAAAQQTKGLTTATTSWMESLSRVRGELIAGAAAFGGFAMVAGNSFSRFAEYEQRMAEISTITDLSGDQMNALSGDVRKLSVAMGKDAAGSAAALYEILSSGVSTDNSIAVLEQSTKAAVAGLTDTKTAATVGLAVINSYGEDVGKLGERYDQLFLTVKNGVVNFPELASSIGQVLPVAAAADVRFAEVTAAMAEMTKQGLKAPIAVTGLRGAINSLSAPGAEAKKAMEELGIQWNGLSGTLQQIAAKNLGAEAMRQIVPDTEARTAVLALTRDIGALVDQVAEMDQAGGTTEAAYNKMKDTPQAEMEKFRSALRELQLAFGEAVAAGLPLIELLRDMLNAFNALPQDLRTSLITLVALGAGAKALQLVVRGMKGGFSGFLGALGKVPTSAAEAGVAIDGLTGKLKGLNRARALSVAKGGGLLAVFGFTADQLYELYQIYQDIQRLEEDQANTISGLQKKADSTAAYGGMLQKTAGEVRGLTETERQEYLKQLKMAEEHWRAKAELISRQSDPSAPVSQEAVDTYKQASEYRKARQAIEDELGEREKADQLHLERQKKIKQEELKVVQQSLAKQLAAYDEANKRLERARQARESIQKEFSSLANEMAGGGAGGSTFGDLIDAKASAGKALRAGDTATAIEEARRAAQILRDLKSAGENTYGFEGIAKELGRIAEEAARLDEEAAGQSLEEEKAKVEGFLQYAEALKRVSVAYVSDTESEEQTRERLKDLAKDFAKYMQIPISFAASADPNMAKAGDLLGLDGDGFATGGYTGPGGKYKPAGIVHAGEYVQPQEVVREPGALAFLERMRRRGFQAVIAEMQERLALRKGYATGGLVTPRALPAVPVPSQALLQAAGGPSFPHLGRLELGLGGSAPITVYTEAGTAEELRKLARKFGKTHR